MESTRQITMDLMKKKLADKTQKLSNDGTETQTEKPKGWFLEKIRPLNQKVTTP